MSSNNKIQNQGPLGQPDLEPIEIGHIGDCEEDTEDGKWIEDEKVNYR